MIRIGTLRRFSGSEVPGPGRFRDETNYLLSSPENARRLYEAIAQLESGGGTTFADVAELRAAVGI